MRLLKKISCAGSRSTSRFRRGSSSWATVVSELRSSKALSMDPRGGGKLCIIIGQLPPYPATDKSQKCTKMNEPCLNSAKLARIFAFPSVRHKKLLAFKSLDPPRAIRLVARGRHSCVASRLGHPPSQQAFLRALCVLFARFAVKSFCLTSPRSVTTYSHQGREENRQVGRLKRLPRAHPEPTPAPPVSRPIPAEPQFPQRAWSTTVP